MPVPIPAAEVAVDARLVRRLLRAQLPDLADLPLRRIGVGWDTVVHRLGRELTVRVPRRQLGAQLLAHEVRWLPELAPSLPVAVPEPVRVGEPTEELPWTWSICRYVPGRPVSAGGLSGALPGEQLAAFLNALHRPAPDEAPRSAFRGVPLAQRDASVRAALAEVPESDRPALSRLWAGVRQTPVHEGPALWLHGDLHNLNVLSVRGRLSGVVDFGDLCAGDPATDLACAWLLLDAVGRARLRAAYRGPAERWERGRGWAVFFAVMFLAHSDQAPENAAIGRRAAAALLEPED